MNSKPLELEVNVSKIIRAKRLIVLRMISKIQDFPKFMPNVISCKVLSTTDKGAITEWKVIFDEIPIQSAVQLCQQNQQHLQL